MKKMMSASAGRIKMIHLVIFFCISILIYPLSWVVVTNSESYSAGVEYIKHSPEVVSKVGVVNKVALDFFGGFYLEGDKADYKYEVDGGLGVVVVSVQLKRDKVVWNVTDFSIEK